MINQRLKNLVEQACLL